MSVGKIEVIKSICTNLNQGNLNECREIIKNKYPFEYIETEKRSYTKRKLVKTFIRDGFIDRYSGDKLVFPGAMMILSKKFPKEMPYHQHGKMEQCHMMWWELYPTIDHIVPVTRGGTNEDENLVCTSMVRNSQKGHYTLEELGWELYPPGDIEKWDGMSKWFVEYVDKNNELLEVNYIKAWYNALKKEMYW